jgi:hypothetical protein
MKKGVPKNVILSPSASLGTFGAAKDPWEEALRRINIGILYTNLYCSG